jgi:hypothetical protein
MSTTFSDLRFLRPSFVALPLLLIAPAQAQLSRPSGADPTNPQMMDSLSAEPPSPSSPSSDAKHTVNSDQRSGRPDFNQDIYYRNKLEFSFETGWLPHNVPLIFDFLVSSPYTTWPLHYTLQPNFLSLRWHVDGIDGPWILRGNTDFTFTGSTTIIPRGPETRYFAFDYGIRRNFIPRRSRVAPYFEMRGGAGDINAKGPDGVFYAQGQNLTFTLMVGSGFRYNFNPKYSLAAGVTYMHVSNAFLSQPRYEDFGINVWGPIVGINVRVGGPKHTRED